MALSEGFAVCPYSPLGGGLLTGKYAAGQSGRLVTNEMYAARYGASWMFDAAAKLSDIAAEVGVDPATLAIAWVARNPAITAPIISGTSIEQLQPSLDGLSYELDDTLFAKISELSPAPVRATDRSEET
jgi:aryl-alcohol dehydrogenase-like predicted oxidoreductase